MKIIKKRFIIVIMAKKIKIEIMDELISSFQTE